MSVLYTIMSENKKSPLRFEPKPAQKIVKSDRTRTVILNAASDFVWSHQFRDMTVSGLMTTTGLSRSAFYQYFKDLHQVMEILLDTVREELQAVTGSWFTGIGDPVVLLNESLDGLVEVCYERGPILRAIADAASTDKRLEKGWAQLFDEFNDAVTTRIEADQGQGLIPDFAARPVAIALNHLDAYTLIEAFGRRPRSKREQLKEALARIWISTLYGSEYVRKMSSNLVRT